MNELLEAAILVFIGLAMYWFFILRPGRLHFWRLVARRADDAYDYFRADTSWKVFEDGLPQDSESVVPNSEWLGPFRMRVPKLGGKTIFIFGKRLGFEESQNDLLSRLKPVRRR